MLFVQLLARFAIYNIAMRESTKIKLSPDTDLAFAKNDRGEIFALITTDYFNESDLKTWRTAILRENSNAKTVEFLPCDYENSGWSDKLRRLALPIENSRWLFVAKIS